MHFSIDVLCPIVKLPLNYCDAVEEEHMKASLAEAKDAGGESMKMQEEESAFVSLWIVGPILTAYDEACWVAQIPPAAELAHRSGLPNALGSGLRGRCCMT
jgi:hypothetical protein